MTRGPKVRSASEVTAERMTEGQLDLQVRRMLNQLQLAPYAFHPYGPGGYQAGYPDWTIAGPEGILYRELKRQKEKPTKAQTAWIERLRLCGLDVDVWRPSDLLSGRIAKELAAIADGRFRVAVKAP